MPSPQTILSRRWRAIEASTLPGRHHRVSESESMDLLIAQNVVRELGKIGAGTAWLAFAAILGAAALAESSFAEDSLRSLDGHFFNDANP
jgi:hypothetical protein